MGLWSWLPASWSRPVPARSRRPAGSRRTARARPGADPGWRALPPVQRTLGDGAQPVARLGDFAGSLATWQSPRMLTGLEHGRGPSAPPGTVAGIVDAVGGAPGLTSLPAAAVTLSRSSMVLRVARRAVTSCSARCGSTGRAGRCSARCRTFAGRRRWCSGRWSRRRDRAVPRRPGCRGFPVGEVGVSPAEPAGFGRRRRPAARAGPSGAGPSGSDHPGPNYPGPNHPGPTVWVRTVWAVEPSGSEPFVARSFAEPADSGPSAAISRPICAVPASRRDREHPPVAQRSVADATRRPDRVRPDPGRHTLAAHARRPPALRRWADYRSGVAAAPRRTGAGGGPVVRDGAAAADGTAGAAGRRGGAARRVPAAVRRHLASPLRASSSATPTTAALDAGHTAPGLVGGAPDAAGPSPDGPVAGATSASPGVGASGLTPHRFGSAGPPGRAPLLADDRLPRSRTSGASIDPIDAPSTPTISRLAADPTPAPRRLGLGAPLTRPPHARPVHPVRPARSCRCSPPDPPDPSTCPARSERLRHRAWNRPARTTRPTCPAAAPSTAPLPTSTPAPPHRTSRRQYRSRSRPSRSQVDD